MLHLAWLVGLWEILNLTANEEYPFQVSSKIESKAKEVG